MYKHIKHNRMTRRQSVNVEYHACPLALAFRFPDVRIVSCSPVRICFGSYRFRCVLFPRGDVTSPAPDRIGFGSYQFWFVLFPIRIVSGSFCIVPRGRPNPTHKSAQFPVSHLGRPNPTPKTGAGGKGHGRRQGGEGPASSELCWVGVMSSS